MPEYAGVTFDKCNTSDYSAVAGEDMRLKQFYAVIPSATGPKTVVSAGAAADWVLGFLQNNPNSGEAANIATVRGSTCKAIAGAAIVLTAGTCALETDAYGRLVTKSAGAIVAYALKAADAADEQIEVVIA